MRAVAAEDDERVGGGGGGCSNRSGGSGRGDGGRGGRDLRDDGGESLIREPAKLSANTLCFSHPCVGGLLLPCHQHHCTIVHNPTTPPPPA
jgi:hypothetical protein